MKSDINDIDSLLKAIRKGLRPRFVFFWGHQPSHNGSFGAACLSQWFTAPFRIEDIAYQTAEHFMMAEKARLFGDTEALEKILAASHPGAAKKLGRKVRAFAEHRWSTHRMDIVVRGNYAKFSQNTALRDYLLGTKNRVLVEASPIDRIWGIGLAYDDPKSADPEQWRGSNLLGFALMKVRTMLQDDVGPNLSRAFKQRTKN